MRHRPWMVVVLFVVSALSVVVGLPPAVDSEVLAMLPPDEPVVRATRKINDEEGGVAFLMLAFSLDDPEGSREALDTFMRDAHERFVEMEEVEYALYTVDEDLARQIGLMQLNPEDVETLSQRIRGALILGRALNPMVLRPLLSMESVTDRLNAAQEASLLSPEDEVGRLWIRPTGPPSDPGFTNRLMHAVDATIAQLQPEERGVHLAWMGGPYRHMLEDYKGIQQDLWWTCLTSLVLVLGLLAFSFRSGRATLLVSVPLVLANLVTLAFSAVWIGHLNTFTSICFALLIGLGIDFAVHLVGRYRELRAAGFDMEEAVARAWDRSGPPCTTAAMTSAAGFLALTVAQFRGFSQLGVLLAVGLLVCLVMMVTVLPLLIPSLDPRPKAPVGLGVIRHSPSRSTYRLAPVALGMVVISTALLAVVQLPKLEFNYDLSSLRRMGMAYNELSSEEQQLAEDSYSPVVITYPSREALSEGHRRIQKRLEDQELHTVNRLLSVENVLPVDQSRRIQALQRLIDQLEHPNLRYLHASVARPLVEALLPLRGTTLTELDTNVLPPELIHVLGGGREGRHRLLLVPTGNMWDMRNAEALLDEVTALEPELEVAGELPATGALYRTVRNDIPWVAGLALFLVFALTAIDIRKPHWVIGAMGTLLAGMVWSGVAVHAVGVRLSIINLVGIPILLGIGIDVIIHMLHRLAEEGPGGVRRAMATTGVAAAISTMTSVASFLSLTMAGNRGVQSLGILVVFGLATVFVVSVLVLPLAWAAGWKMTGRAPADTVPPAGYR